MDMNFSTKGMTCFEREELFKTVEPIPLGTEVYKAGGAFDWTAPVVVTKENQKMITMFWNSMYFLSREDADQETMNAHSKYGQYQQAVADGSWLVLYD